MPTHAEKKNLPYTPEQMFDLVLDIERYPEFLPWCLTCEIIKETENDKYANMVIGYKIFREWFQCKVTFNRPDKIRVEYINGPLKYLSNTWDFQPTATDGCVIDFYVDFEFKNPIFKKLMGVFFNEIVKRMVKAFEDRAKQLYGRKSRAKTVKKKEVIS
jgi:coenzyme Q-binding protein COQ10